jgi:hypothetical protein
MTTAMTQAIKASLSYFTLGELFEPSHDYTLHSFFRTKFWSFITVTTLPLQVVLKSICRFNIAFGILSIELIAKAYYNLYEI